MSDERKPAGNVTGEFMCGGTRPTNRHCQTCDFANGNPPFEDHPNKAYCRMYLESDGWGKPRSVTFGGEDCIFYRRASDELIAKWKAVTRSLGLKPAK